MKTPEEYYLLARQLFLIAYPEQQQTLNRLTAEDARAFGLSLPQLREMQADRIYAAFLREKKQDAILFSIQLAEPDQATAARAIESYLKSHAKALGMSWETFCTKNNL